jgi:hypothetical protein
MSNTKREPLLSDDAISEAFLYGPLVVDALHGYLSGANYARDIYEADRAKDAELIQRLVDALENLREIHQEWAGREALTGMDELAAAKAAGFKPLEP